jgi:hypothetical protein
MSKKIASDDKVSNFPKSGYFLYEDGMSFWGLNTLRFSNYGVEITDELHKKPVDEKITWYKEDAAKRDKANKEAEAAKKAKENA